MNYPFNEPIQINLRTKSRLLSILNRIPYAEYLLWLSKRRFPRLGKLVVGEIIVTPKIIEEPLVVRSLELRDGTLLDAGCCESKLPIELASLGYQVYGVDLRNYPLSHPNFYFKKADLMHLPFSSNYFDYVISISTLEHVGHGFYDDPVAEGGDRKAIMEMKRVLKPYGKMLITVPYGGKPWPKSSIWHNSAHWYNKNSLKALLRDFKIDEKQYFVRKEGNWLLCSENDTENVDPGSCNVFLKLSKQRSSI